MLLTTLSVVLVAASYVSARAIPSYGRALAGPAGVNFNRAVIDLSVSSANSGTNKASSAQDKNSKNTSSSSIVSSNSTNSTASKTVNKVHDNNKNNSNVNSNNNNNNTNSSDNNNSNNSNSNSSLNATATDSAASATRTRPCNQEDQSLAAGLQVAVNISFGQQVSVVTLVSANNTQDITDGISRLQQFVDLTMKLQLELAQTTADKNSVAQKQLQLLQASQINQEQLVGELASGAAQVNTQNLDTLLRSFLDSTNNAQDGASHALIDCFLPTTLVSD